MNVYKLISTFFLILFLSSSIYSEGFFDRADNYNYYVNNPTPEVEVYIRVPADNLVIMDATLKFNSEDKFLDLVDELVPARTYEYIKKIKLSEFPGQGPISSDDEVVFELNVVKQGTSKKIQTSGDPLKFNIILDEVSPELIFPTSNSVLVNELDQSFSFKFSEKISKFEIRDLNNNIILSRPSESKIFEDEYSDIVKFNFENGELVEGDNNYVISFYDLADNKVDAQINFAFIGDALSINLLTRRDDSKLKYFFDKEYSTFFGNKIQYFEDEYDLVLTSSKPSKCYFSSSFLGFVEYKNLLSTADYYEFTSSDSLKHTYSMNGQKLVWVACQDLSFPDEVVYLNQVLGFGDKLVSFEKYTLDFEISKFYPQAVVSNVPFEVEVQTTQNTICNFNIDNEGIRQFSSEGVIDYKKHIKDDISLSDGSHSIDVECFDKVYNVKSEVKEVLVDTTSGPRVIGDKTFYSDSASTPIVLQFSEDAVCVSNKNQIEASEFNSSTSVSGTGLEKTITPNDLDVGENDYYIYCRKDGQMIGSKIEILFDPNQPTIKDLVFVNDNENSEYLFDNKKVKYKVTYEGLIPVDRYQVSIVYSNFTVNKNFSKSSGVYSGDVSDAQKFKIQLFNILGKSSNILEKQIKFDLKAPIVSITDSGNDKKITCVDEGSGCDKWYYGFSQTAVNCVASTVYEKDEVIDTGDNYYMCARVVDGVGNVGKDTKNLYDNNYNYDGSLGGDGNIEDGEDNLDNTEDPKTDNGKEDNVDDNPFVQNPGDGETTTESNGLIIAAAIIVFLGSIGGGGYYAYREGYLDKQLEKFGIFRNTGNKVATSTVKGSPSNMYTPIGKSSNDSKQEVKKTGYDRNLKKINSFIDDTLNKGNDVFDSFGSSSKGKTKGYEDTLLTGTKPKKNSQEFSLNKNNGVAKVNTESIEKEAEEFENYFKEKGTKVEDKKTSNKKD
jgi:hypothetical protein